MKTLPLLFLIFLIACHRSDPNNMTGKWKLGRDGKELTVDIKDDAGALTGTITTADIDGGEVVTFKGGRTNTMASIQLSSLRTTENFVYYEMITYSGPLNGLVWSGERRGQYSNTWLKGGPDEKPETGWTKYPFIARRLK